MCARYIHHRFALLLSCFGSISAACLTLCVPVAPPFQGSLDLKSAGFGYTRSLKGPDRLSFQWILGQESPDLAWNEVHGCVVGFFALRPCEQAGGGPAACPLSGDCVQLKKLKALWRAFGGIEVPI